MRRIKTYPLIILVIALSATIAVVRDLRIVGYLSLETQRVTAYLMFGLNLLVASLGLWTRFRLAWLSSMFLLSSTPITAAWILLKLAIRHVFV
jgi:hypothetical protein